MGIGSSADAADVDDQPSAAGELAYVQAQALEAQAASVASDAVVQEGGIWNGPSTALVPDAAWESEAQATGWFLPHGSTLFPATSSMQTLKGMRPVDSTPARLGESPSGFASTTVKPAVERATRTGLESEISGLCASLGAARALQDALGKKVRSMREALARGDVSYGVGEDGGDEFCSTVHMGLQAHRMQFVSLEAELDRYRDKIRAHACVSERQKREMDTVKRDSELQGERATTAQKEAKEAREQLKKAQQELAELTRKAKTEQLRVEMLREAFDQEQTRVGVSLGRAEAFVSDLVAATEGTRRVEVEEQTLARECVSALSEIHASEAHDELKAEAECRSLRRELALAEAECTENGIQQRAQGTSSSAEADLSMVTSAAAYASVVSEQHAAATQLADARRKCHGASIIARRCLANEAELRRSMEALKEEQSELMKASQQASSSSTRMPRLQFEEAADGAIRKAEAKVTGIISAARESGLDLTKGGRRQPSPISDSARQCALAFGAELELVRSELSETSRAVSVPARSSATTQGADWRLDLEAAGLQRKLGKALAAEREKHCQLLEARVRSGQLLPKDIQASAHRQGATRGAGIDTLQEQVKVLQSELHIKDAEIDRLTRNSSISKSAQPVRGRTS